MSILVMLNFLLLWNIPHSFLAQDRAFACVLSCFWKTLGPMLKLTPCFIQISAPQYLSSSPAAGSVSLSHLGYLLPPS